jgi:hypothetical protein
MEPSNLIETYVHLLNSIGAGGYYLDGEDVHRRADTVLLSFVERIAPEIAEAYFHVQGRADFWAYS